MKRLDLKPFRTVTPGFTRRWSWVRLPASPLYKTRHFDAVGGVKPTGCDRPKTAAIGTDGPNLWHTGVTARVAYMAALVALLISSACDGDPHRIPCNGTRETAGEVYASVCEAGCKPHPYVAKGIALVVCLPKWDPPVDGKKEPQ